MENKQHNSNTIKDRYGHHLHLCLFFRNSTLLPELCKLWKTFWCSAWKTNTQQSFYQGLLLFSPLAFFAGPAPCQDHLNALTKNFWCSEWKTNQQQQQPDTRPSLSGASGLFEGRAPIATLFWMNQTQQQQQQQHPSGPPVSAALAFFEGGPCQDSLNGTSTKRSCTVSPDSWNFDNT